MQEPQNNNEKKRKKRLLILLLLLLLPLLGTGFWIGWLGARYLSQPHPVQHQVIHVQKQSPVVAHIPALPMPSLAPLENNKQPKVAAVYLPKVSSAPKMSVVKKVTPVKSTVAKSASSGTYIATSEKAPPGFEFLSEPVDTIVDVFYAGSFVASVSATYTPSTITFHNPKNFLDKIKSVKNRAAVEKALTGELPNNSHLVCLHHTQQNCGRLDPQVAGVIFNANKFRADIFINQNNLLPGEAPNPFIPLPNAGFSFVSNIYGVTNGVTHEHDEPASNSYGFRAVNDLGYKETMLHSEFSYSQNDFESNVSHFHVDQLNMGHYFSNKYLVRGGILDSVGNTFVSNQTFAGASFGTTLDTLKEDSTSFGTKLQVFLPSPSYVSIYRDGRLLAAKYYPAGNQVLDTSQLPNGAYQVTLRIRDAQGSISEETRFFSKSSQIPPMEFPQYYGSVGYLEKNEFDQTTSFPEFENVPVYQVGYNKRIQSNWGISTSLIGTNQESLASAGVFLLGKGFQINPQVLYGTDKEHGVGLEFQTNINKFSASLFGRRIWATNKSQLSNDINSVDVEELPVSNFITANQDSTQVDANVGYTIGKVFASINGHVSKFADLPTVYSYGPDIRFPLMHQDGTNLDMHISGARSQDDWQVLAQLVVYFSSPNWIVNSNVGYQSINDRNDNANQTVQDSGAIGNAAVYWQNLNPAQEGAILGVNSSTEPGRQSVGGSAQYTAPLGGVYGSLQHNAGSNVNDNTQYSANFETHIAYADKHTAVGGARSGENTGVIIDIESPTPGDEFQVLVDEQVRKIVKTGHPTPVFLTPFRTYHIRIKAVSPRFYEYSEVPKTVTLYKGNFKTLEWHTKQKVIIFGYVETVEGKPLKDSILRGGVGINATDNDGSAQIEVYDNAKTLTSHLPNGEACVINLPKLNTDGSLTVAKKLICRAATGGHHAIK